MVLAEWEAVEGRQPGWQYSATSESGVGTENTLAVESHGTVRERRGTAAPVNAG